MRTDIDKTITIQVPRSIAKYREFIEQFVNGMMYKLDVNSYKDTPTVKTVPTIIDMLLEEVREFNEQFYENRHDYNALVELMDVANFAFLAYIALEQEVKDGRKI
jgi:hypothetical protein